MQTSRRLSALGSALVLLAPLAAAMPTQAAVLEAGSESFPIDVLVTDFCDVEGLDVLVTGTFTARYLIVSHGKDQLPYFLQTSTVTRTFTNVDTGTFVTDFSKVLEKDLKVTDNGDGTFTILVLGTGSASLKDQDGRLIGANPGQLRWEILIDNGGTPTDPSDDEFIADLGPVFGSTGRNDDFCEVVVPALT